MRLIKKLAAELRLSQASVIGMPNRKLAIPKSPPVGGY